MDNYTSSSTEFKQNLRLPLSPITNVIRLAILGLTIASHSSYSATVEVTSHLDHSGDDCILREAIESISSGDDFGGCIANGIFGVNDLITFSADLLSNKIILNNGQLNLSDLEQPLTIDASTITGGITIDGNQASRVLSINTVNSVTLDGLTITRGLTNYSGGAIYAFGSPTNLVLNNCTISGNSAGADGGGIGGAILASGVNVSMNNCNIIDNSAPSGGGISSTNGASINLISSTVSNNSAGSGAGLLAQSNGNISLDKSTVSGNVAGSSGGGLFASFESSVTINNSTISGNSSSRGAGLNLSFDSSLILSNSTVSRNSSDVIGGGLYANNSDITLSNTTFSDNLASINGAGLLAFNESIININNSIIANSENSSDCYQNLSSINIDSATIVEDGSCGASRTGDPSLMPLSDNGGSTLTQPLSVNSIARGTGDLTSCTTNDQRGQLRDDGDGSCDVGAIEFNASDNPTSVEYFIIPLSDNNSVIVPL